MVTHVSVASMDEELDYRLSDTIQKGNKIGVRKPPTPTAAAGFHNNLFSNNF